MNAEERARAVAISRLGYSNPFLPERIENERAVLGTGFTSTDAIWTVRADREVQNPNVARIGELAGALAARLRERLVGGAAAAEADRALYEDVVTYLVYTRFENELLELVLRADGGRVGFFERFAADYEHWLALPGVHLPSEQQPAHLFACLFQVRRAFHHIFWHIIGGSMPMARLRAGVWQSIFTHDMRRYRRALYARMDDITTLVAGPSGTGKELVARAIALSRYIPFDPKTQRFTAHFADLFHPLNLSALSPTLIESEVFGHRRGAFTGALQDRAGWFETCEPLGTVFLDEIGDVDASIQVKLLRVLQTRTFQRLGDTKSLPFRGKVIAATNRDLAVEIHAGRFREDFYYRLCSDIIRTPSLEEQLRESPGELSELVRFIARRVVGDAEGPTLADEVDAWMGAHLGSDYPWPGNVRELEQCVRNVLIRGEYRPPARPSSDGDELAAAMAAGTLTADELLGRYCTLVYARTGSYQETARRLGLDRRTVKSKVTTIP
jgi:DNA-binding NtrC family response regulator